MNIQKIINDFLSRFPNVDRFIEFVEYVGPNKPLPVGTTHTLKLANTEDQDVVIALKVKAPYQFIVNALLQLL